MVLLISIMLVMTGCKTTNPSVLSLPNNWIDENTYRTISIGYPYPNVEKIDYEKEAYLAGYNFAVVKTTEAFIKEMPEKEALSKNKLEKLTESVKKHLKVIKYRYNDSYVEMTVEVKIDALLKMLRKGVVVF